MKIKRVLEEEENLLNQEEGKLQLDNLEKPIFDDNFDEELNERILAEKSGIYTPSQNAKIKLNEYAIKFSESGQNPLKTGKQTLITLDKFESIKAVINLEKAAMRGDTSALQDAAVGVQKNSMGSGTMILLSTFFSFFFLLI